MSRRRKAITSPDALLDRALACFDVELRRLERHQRAGGYLTEEDQRHLVRMTNSLRELEADRNRPWDPRRLHRMTDHEIDEEIRRSREAEDADRRARSSS